MEGRRVSVCNDEGFAILFFDPNRMKSRKFTLRAAAVIAC